MDLYTGQGKEIADDLFDQAGIVAPEVKLIVFGISSVPEQGGDIQTDLVS